MNASDVLAWIYSNAFVRFVLALMFADLLTGIAVAILPHTAQEFRLGAVADFLKQSVVFLIGGGAMSAVAHFALPEYQQVADATAALVWTLVLAALFGKLLDNLRVIFPNAPIPRILTDKPRTPAEP